MTVRSPPSGLARGRTLRTVASLVVSAVLLALAARQVDAAALWAQLRAADLRWIAAAVPLYFVELLVRERRWSLILSPVQRLPFMRTWGALLVGYAANTIMPARMGELFRADFAARDFGMSRWAAVGTIVGERALDLLVVLGCAALGTLLVLPRQSQLFASLHAVLLAVAGVLGAAILGAYAVIVLARTPLPRFPAVARMLAALRDGFATIARLHLLAPAVALSLAVWLCNAVVMLAILRAVHVAADAWLLVLLIGVCGIAAALPAAPAGLGTLQFAFVTVLAQFGVPAASGFAAALFVQVFVLGSVALAGMTVYARWHWRRPAAAAP
jgi:uncharacterized membrane protein YbhN (UPF0104 family)